MPEPLVSVIIPAHNEELNIDKVVEALSNVFAEISTKFELIFVDDGSKDGTWGKIMLASSGIPS
jgi:dolichol-phosphate mannosyltransferase